MIFLLLGGTVRIWILGWLHTHFIYKRRNGCDTLPLTREVSNCDFDDDDPPAEMGRGELSVVEKSGVTMTTTAKYEQDTEHILPSSIAWSTNLLSHSVGSRLLASRGKLWYRQVILFPWFHWFHCFLQFRWQGNCSKYSVCGSGSSSKICLIYFRYLSAAFSCH